jgi:hypothetical protein
MPDTWIAPTFRFMHQSHTQLLKVLVDLYAIRYADFRILTQHINSPILWLPPFGFIDYRAK